MEKLTSIVAFRNLSIVSRRGERWIVEWINQPIIKRQSYIVVDREASIDIREGGSASGKKYVDIAWNEFNGGWCRLRDMLSHLHQRSKGVSAN